MKNIFYSFIVLFLSSFMLASCLKSNDADVTYYDDTAIATFSLGTLNRYLHTKSSTGEDSIYKTTLAASTYKFNIDQLRHEIYNPDSLPIGTDVSKVVVTASALNSGTIVVNKRTKDKTKDSLLIYSSSDSLDFTEPLEFRVYNSTGTAFRKYKVSVNVHKERAEEFKWTQVSEKDPLLASSQGMRLLSFDGKLWLMTSDGTACRLYKSETKQPLSWQLASQDVYAADAYKSFVLSFGALTFVSGSKAYQIIKKEETYETSSMDLPSIKYLLGSHEIACYGLFADGLMKSCLEWGGGWKEEPLDASSDLLPTEDVNLVFLTSRINSVDNKLILVGNRSETQYPSDQNAVIWSKVEEADITSTTQTWAYYSLFESNKYKLPRMKNLQVIGYDGYMLAIGGNAINGTATAFSQFYKSIDEGLTWQNDTTLYFPKNFSSSNTVFTMACDNDNYIWICAGESGQVWKGRPNELGWRKEQGAFEN